MCVKMHDSFVSLRPLRAQVVDTDTGGTTLFTCGYAVLVVLRYWVGYVWLLFGYYLLTIWLLSDYYLATMWLLSDYYVATMWLLSSSYLITIWLLS